MIGKVIKFKFDNNATLNGLFAGRVYPFIAAQGVLTAPYAVYEVVRTNPNGTKDNDSEIDETLVRITVVSTKYSDIQTAVEGVRATFPRTSGPVAGVQYQSCSFDDFRDIYSDKDEFFGGQIDLIFRIPKS
jgi:hypothetical protein